MVNYTNVSAKTKGNYNYCDDFLKLVTYCHIVTAAMEYLSMDSLTDTPSDCVIKDAASAWTLTKAERANLLKNICGNIVDKYIPFTFHNKFKQSCDQDIR